MDSTHDLISDLQIRIVQLEQQKSFLEGEIRVAIKSFTHHGLQGSAWLAGQALKLVDQIGVDNGH